MAAAGGHIDTVGLLLGFSGIIMDQMDIYGRTSLMYALQQGHDRIVTLLSSKVAVDVNLKSPRGRTLLWEAASTGCKETIKMLIEAGCQDVNPMCEDGEPPLSCAAKNSYSRRLPSCYSGATGLT